MILNIYLYQLQSSYLFALVDNNFSTLSSLSRVNNSFTVTLTANVTLQNPSNATAGQGGTIYLIQDATGSRTMAFGGAYKFPAGTVPVLSTSTSAVDILVYNVRDTSLVDSVVIKSFGR